MKMFRRLRPDEIECRVQRVTPKGVVLLLYKTARTDADLLDETVGADRSNSITETKYKNTPLQISTSAY